MSGDFEHLLARVGLDVASGGPMQEAVDLCLRYLDVMLETNRQINLTAIRDPIAARVLHVIDSLMLWHIVIEDPRVVIDLGSGNGFPGVAAAAIWPHARVICVERTAKKARAIQACAEAAGFLNVETLALDAAQIPARAPELKRTADLVLSRAMADLGPTTRLARPLLAVDRAVVIHWKAKTLDSAERREGSKAAKEARLQIRDDYVYTLPDDEGRTRRLVAYVHR